MTALAVLLVLAICAGIAYLMWATVQPDESNDIDGDFSPEEIVRFRLEQHRIQRRLDTRLTRHEQRREAERVKRELAEAFRDGE